MEQSYPQPSRTEVLAHIRDSAFFRPLSEEHQRELASHLELVSLAAGQWLFQQGDPGDDGMYIVIEGRLEVSVEDPRGAPGVVNEPGPGSIVGEIGMIAGGARTANVRTAADTKLLKICKATFDRLCSTSSELLDGFARVIAERLRRPQLLSVLSNFFGAKDLATLEEIEREMTWVRLPRGATLVRRGESGDKLYLLVSGRLQSTVADRATLERPVGELVAGESVGELQLLTGEPHSATVYSARSCELVELPKAGFERLVSKHPQIMRHLTRQIIQRVQPAVYTSRPKATHQAIDIVLAPIRADVPLAEFTRLLAEKLSLSGATLVLDEARLNAHLGLPDAAQTKAEDPNDIRLELWLNDQAARYAYRLFQTDVTMTPWTERCLRHADRILLIGRWQPDPTPSSMERAIQESMQRQTRIQQTLVLLHDSGNQHPSGTRRWLARRQVEQHHHVRLDTDADFGRLARFLADRSIGLVLSGGGARGWAHTGVIRALEELGVPIDRVGGNSSGAIVAGLYAKGLSWEAIQEQLVRVRRFAIRAIDPTLPITSLLKGDKQRKLVEQLFGDVHVDDLFRDFYCVSSNLTRAELFVHECGPLWRGVLGSNIVPGLMPPLEHGGDLLVDGTFLDNFPVGVMRQRCQGGTVIGVDVSRAIDLGAVPDASHSGLRLLLHKLNPPRSGPGPPAISALVYRAAELGSVRDRRRQLEQGMVDVYLQPPLEGFGMLDYHAVREIVEAGYEYARKALPKTHAGELTEIRQAIA